MRIGFKWLFLFWLLLGAVAAIAQISSAHIVFERKTNLYKKFKSEEVQNWITEADRNKVDTFELFFNDSLSYFGPKESDLKEKMSWATTKTKVYINHHSGDIYAIKDIWSEEVHVQDSTINRSWKIVPGKRKICGYECQKALWRAGDTLSIYAWFANEISPSVGPETFTGLPGTILGIATEDGGVVYFARQVLLERISPEVLLPKKHKGKVYERSELKAKLEKDFGKEPWGKLLIAELFGVW